MFKKYWGGDWGWDLGGWLPLGAAQQDNKYGGVPGSKKKKKYRVGQKVHPGFLPVTSYGGGEP